MKISDKLLGWAMPFTAHASLNALAHALGHRDPHDGCLPRRQGKCPGLEHCLDCPWHEGTSRQDG